MDIKQELLKLLERRVFNAEELVEEIDKLYKQNQALQLQQTGVMVSSLRKSFAISREKAVKVAEINAIRHCLELYANFEVDEEVIEEAVKRYRGKN